MVSTRNPAEMVLSHYRTVPCIQLVASLLAVLKLCKYTVLGLAVSRYWRELSTCCSDGTQGRAQYCVLVAAARVSL